MKHDSSRLLCFPGRRAQDLLCVLLGMIFVFALAYPLQAGQGDFDRALLSKIWINRTNEKEVVDLFGEPTTIETDKTFSTCYIYEFITTRKKRVVGNLLYLPLFLVVGPAPLEYYQREHSLKIFFDHDGTVKAYDYDSGDERQRGFVNQRDKVQVDFYNGDTLLFSSRSEKDEYKEPFVSFINEVHEHPKW